MTDLGLSELQICFARLTRHAGPSNTFSNLSRNGTGVSSSSKTHESASHAPMFNQ